MSPPRPASGAARGPFDVLREYRGRLWRVARYTNAYAAIHRADRLYEAGVRGFVSVYDRSLPDGSPAMYRPSSRTLAPGTRPHA